MQQDQFYASVAQPAPTQTFSQEPETLSSSPVNPESPAEVPAEPTASPAPEAECLTVVDVQFKSSGRVYYYNPGRLEIPDDTDVVIETAKGSDFGHCVHGNHQVPKEGVNLPLRSVLRIATDNDRRMLAEYRSREPEAMRICEEKILRHGLDMKLVSAEYAFDGSKILFFFTSDGRVDFRDLVKDLASVFRTRIELRQIGVRDEAKMLGGLGICGRPFCCKQFLDDFQPVSIKMAKTQSLSLNPTKISGTCGRLMCCLKYEQDGYESFQHESPKLESLVDTPEGRGTIEDIVLLRRQAKVRLQAYPDTVKLVSWDDLSIVRSGRPRKEDLEAEAAEAAQAQAAAQAAKRSYPQLTGLDPTETEATASSTPSHTSSYTSSHYSSNNYSSNREKNKRSWFETNNQSSQASSSSTQKSKSKSSYKSKGQSSKAAFRAAERAEAQAVMDEFGVTLPERKYTPNYSPNYRRRNNYHRPSRKNKSSGNGEGTST